MRPPILGLTVAFGAGLITALSGVELRVTACLVLLGAAALYRRAPLGAALGVMLVAGVLWGSAARQEQAASCNGRWAHQSVLTPDWQPGVNQPVTHSVIVQLTDPVSAAGGVAEAVVQAGGCRGTLTIRWPDGHPARGGTTWVVAGRFLGDQGRGVLVRLRLGPRARFAAGTGVMLAYVWLLGFPAPAARSAAMLALLDVAKLRQRVVAPRGLVALAAFCVMLGDPWAVQSVGAWLSVAAVAAVIWAGRATERLPKAVRVLAPAAAATLLTAPITAYSFGTVAPIGVVANIAAIPLAGLAVPGLMVALLLSSSWLAAGAGLCLALLDVVAKAAAALPGGHFIMIAGARAAVLWLGILALAWWLWNSPRRRWTVAARVAFVAVLISWPPLVHRFRSLSGCQCPR